MVEQSRIGSGRVRMGRVGRVELERGVGAGWHLYEWGGCALVGLLKLPEARQVLRATVDIRTRVRHLAAWDIVVTCEAVGNWRAWVPAVRRRIEAAVHLKGLEQTEPTGGKREHGLEGLGAGGDAGGLGLPCMS